MSAVDAVIRLRLHSDVVLVRQVADYIIGAGGKRMRPALAARGELRRAVVMLASDWLPDSSRMLAFGWT